MYAVKTSLITPGHATTCSPLYANNVVSTTTTTSSSSRIDHHVMILIGRILPSFSSYVSRNIWLTRLQLQARLALYHSSPVITTSQNGHIYGRPA